MSPRTRSRRCTRRSRTHKRVSEIWADELVRRGDRSRAPRSSAAQQRAWDELTDRHQELRAKIAERRESGVAEPAHRGVPARPHAPRPEPDTTVPEALLREYNEGLLRLPERFTVHPKLVRQLERRREALDGEIDWAHAEALAFASLLADGTPIRLTGQDTERGTFSQRHLVLHDAEHRPDVLPDPAACRARRPRSSCTTARSRRSARSGFEYGYSQESPETLVLWEAQFGDFVNSAQVIVDQFIASGLAKWGQTSRLTLLLPHGYEGSGPEHSSARLERFLSLAAEGNLRIANPTTPAQYFHLLRRQAMIVKQRPLIVMTPKSLLRLPQATSRIDELTSGGFQPVLAEPGVDGVGDHAPDPLHRQDLLRPRRRTPTAQAREPGRGRPRRAALPVPRAGGARAARRATPTCARSPGCRRSRATWARAPTWARACSRSCPRALHYGYVGRPERASPGEGYPAAHVAEQNRILRDRARHRGPAQRLPGEDARRAIAPRAPDPGARQLNSVSSGSRSPRSTARSTTTHSIPRAAASTEACGLICCAASTPRQSLNAGSRRIRSR